MAGFLIFHKINFPTLPKGFDASYSGNIKKTVDHAHGGRINSGGAREGVLQRFNFYERLEDKS